MKKGIQDLCRPGLAGSQGTVGQTRWVGTAVGSRCFDLAGDIQGMGHYSG